jgi:hypothetical protein
MFKWSEYFQKHYPYSIIQELRRDLEDNMNKDQDENIKKIFQGWIKEHLIYFEQNYFYPKNSSSFISLRRVWGQTMIIKIYYVFVKLGASLRKIFP